MQNKNISSYGPKESYLSIYEQKFEKTIVMFEVSILEFAIMQRFVQKDKSLNLGPKMTYMSIFGLEFQKPLSYLKLVLSN